MVNSDKYGFPRGKPKLRQKSFYGFQTGDIIRADIPKGKYTGIHTGRISVRSRGSFKLKTSTQTFDVNHKYCKHLQKSDGYNYSFGELVKQKIKAGKQIVNELITPNQLSLFDVSNFAVEVEKTKTKRTRKFKGGEGEQLSLF